MSDKQPPKDLGINAPGSFWAPDHEFRQDVIAGRCALCDWPKDKHPRVLRSEPAIMMAGPKADHSLLTSATIRAQRERIPLIALRPERIVSPPSPPDAKMWVINDIRIGNAMAPPYTDEDRKREAEAAARHEPVITRTLFGGPGNYRRLQGCCCRAAGVHDAATWTAHVGVPGAGPLIEKTLALQDAVDDALNYPSKETQDGLRAALRRSAIRPPLHADDHFETMKIETFVTKDGPCPPWSNVIGKPPTEPDK